MKRKTLTAPRRAEIMIERWGDHGLRVAGKNTLHWYATKAIRAAVRAALRKRRGTR